MLNNQLPENLPTPLAIERDYQIGMTKFHMRRDYAGAAGLLLKVAPALTGDKAAAAWFHGTRALSRIDRDDEAIAGYKQLVVKFPASRFAAEAQFLSGWLDYNRGRYRESLPGLRATIDRYAGSAFVDDAAWCLAFAHYLLGDIAQATQALERYAALRPSGMTVDEHAARAAYWRARIHAKTGDAETATSGYREVNRRWPFTFYGAAARARLAESGTAEVIELPAPTGYAISSPSAVLGLALASSASSSSSSSSSSSRTTSRRDGDRVRNPDTLGLARIDELASVGLEREAGLELEREERAARSDRAKGGSPLFSPAILMPKYAALKNFHRAFELAESRNAGALGTAPVGSSRVWWEAAYPLAYREFVEPYGKAAGNPDLFLYAIMRKESAFSPSEVSYADARGLLQMIPPTSARVAHDANLDFTADDLFDPDVNIRLGSLYIGTLSKKFAAQIPLVAAAYNAGPKSVARWCDQHGTHPIDEFVELITFTQSREYTKRVVGIYSRYRHLYGPSAYQLLLTVNPQYSSAGGDF